MALEFAELTDLKTVEGYRIALTPNNSLVVYAPDGIRGFPELACGFRRRDASPIRFIGRLRSVPPTVEAVIVDLLTRQDEVRKRIAKDYGDDEVVDDAKERTAEMLEEDADDLTDEG